MNITVTAVNDPPSLSGTPPTSAGINVSYSFTPTLSTAFGEAGQNHTFSIENAPAWAIFNAFTGQLSGTPAPNDLGEHLGIVISASDSESPPLSDSLGPFSITVVDTTAPTTTATPLPTEGYTSSRTVTLNCVDDVACAAIHFTSNGTTPTTNSPVYSGAITLTASTTLRFFGVDTSGNKESVNTLSYLIDVTPPEIGISTPIDRETLN